MPARLTNAVRDICVRLADKKDPGTSEAEQRAWSDAFDLDLIQQVNFDYELTEKGKQVAAERRALLEKQRATRRAYAAGRASAMDSIGMRRTRSGSWE